MSLFTRRNFALALGMTVAAALTAGALIAATAKAAVGPAVGAAAPNFTGTTSLGTTLTLADYADQTVVLEWTNKGCPYVNKHYRSGNIPGLQAAAIADGVVWLQIVSSAPGKQGYVKGAEADAWNASMGAAPTAVILDPTGAIGHLYDARTTPQLFVIEEGALAYKGAIDSKATTRKADIETATPYVKDALAAVKAGEPVATPETKPYGCSVKYGSNPA